MVAKKISSSSNCDCDLEYLINFQIKHGFTDWGRGVDPDDHLDIKFGIETFLTPKYQVTEFTVTSSSTPMAQIPAMEKSAHDQLNEDHSYVSVWKLETDEFVRFDMKIKIDEDYPDPGEVYENLESPCIF